MPIKKENRSKYPKNWPSISDRIRFKRARGRCECMGECGRTHEVFTTHDKEVVPSGTTLRCLNVNGRPSPFTGAKIVLTVAHLDHNPANCAEDNLVAMCQRCHLAYDSEIHRANAAATRAAKASAVLNGQ